MPYVETALGFVFETDHPEWHPDTTVLTQSEGKRKRKEYCLAKLKKALPQGTTVYSVLRHVSASGMSRRIDFYTMKDNRPQFLTGYIAHALGYSWTDKAGLVVKGCGMDMGFHVVYSLSYALFPDGFKDGQDERKDGGYALRHEWI